MLPLSIVLVVVLVLDFGVAQGARIPVPWSLDILKGIHGTTGEGARLTLWRGRPRPRSAVAKIEIASQFPNSFFSGSFSSLGERSFACFDGLLERQFMEPKRCGWAIDPLSIEYHDLEWGVPLHDDQRLFEMIVLESMQSGLSWITILRKRPAFRAAFLDFEPQKVAKFGPREVNKLLTDPGIIRNRLKVEAAIANAKATLRIQKAFGSLDSFLWKLVDGKPLINRWTHARQIPARTPVSENLAKELKAHGFQFIGPTVAYALMQAIGMVNDHEISCDRYRELVQSP